MEFFIVPNGVVVHVPLKLILMLEHVFVSLLMLELHDKMVSLVLEHTSLLAVILIEHHHVFPMLCRKSQVVVLDMAIDFQAECSLLLLSNSTNSRNLLLSLLLQRCKRICFLLSQGPEKCISLRGDR